MTGGNIITGRTSTGSSRGLWQKMSTRIQEHNNKVFIHELLFIDCDEQHQSITYHMDQTSNLQIIVLHNQVMTRIHRDFLESSYGTR